MYNEKNFPLFPLGIVLLPGMITPLHIFEERYKQMINRCIENKESFGIVYYSGNKMHEKGCTAEIVGVINKNSNGTMDILIEGKERFNIEATNSNELYLQGDITIFDDEYELSGNDLEISRVQGIKLLKEVLDIYGNGMENIIFDDFDAKTVSFLITSNSAFTMDEKQSFLEMINTKERIEKAVKSLNVLVERIKSAKEIEKIIQSNGYLPKKHD
ncbi:MAG: LON peptidase substrate-binding domain-containing protein [Candidatus Sericytochromatia bacterium]